MLREQQWERVARRAREIVSHEATQAGTAVLVTATIEVDGKSVVLDYKPLGMSSFTVDGKVFKFGNGLGEMRTAAQQLQLTLWPGFALRGPTSDSFADHVIEALIDRAGVEREAVLARAFEGMDRNDADHELRLAAFRDAPAIEFVVQLRPHDFKSRELEIAVTLYLDHERPSVLQLRWKASGKSVGRPQPFTYVLGSATKAALAIEEIIASIAHAEAAHPVAPASAHPATARAMHS